MHLSWTQSLLLAGLSLSPLFGGGCNNFRTAGFQNPVTTQAAAGKYLQTLGLGDLDGDGRLDAVVADSSYFVNVLISKGDGTFATGAAYAGDKTGGSRTIAVGDISGDGRADVVVGVHDGNGMSIYYNQGDGRLAPPSATLLNVGCKPEAFVLADFDGDSHPDIVVACSNPNQVQVLHNKGGTSGFDAPNTLTFDQAGSNGNLPTPRSIAVADLNGNGTADIVVGTDSDMRILSDPKVGPRSYPVSIPESMRTVSVAIGDVNGNGVPDVACLVNNQELHVYEYAAGGTFNAVVSYRGVGSNGRSTNQGLAAADFLKQGHTDLVVTLPNPSEVRLVINQSELGPVASPTVASYQYQMGLSVSDNCFSVGDVTGDGLPDVAVRSNDSVSVLVNASTR
jgi:hypothetical protein